MWHTFCEPRGSFGSLTVPIRNNQKLCVSAWRYVGSCMTQTWCSISCNITNYHINGGPKITHLLTKNARNVMQEWFRYYMTLLMEKKPVYSSTTPSSVHWLTIRSFALISVSLATAFWISSPYNRWWATDGGMTHWMPSDIQSNRRRLWLGNPNEWCTKILHSRILRKISVNSSWVRLNVSPLEEADSVDSHVTILGRTDGWKSIPTLEPPLFPCDNDRVKVKNMLSREKEGEYRLIFLERWGTTSYRNGMNKANFYHSDPFKCWYDRIIITHSINETTVAVVLH